MDRSIRETDYKAGGSQKPETRSPRNRLPVDSLKALACGNGSAKTSSQVTATVNDWMELR